MSCRIGEILKEGLKSVNLKVLMLRNNLIQVIQGSENHILGLNDFPNLIELELYDNKILQIDGLDALLSL